MSKEQNIVIIAGYQATEPATKNFDALVQLVKGKKIQTDGMILVQKDLDGKITVNETGDHLGRKGVAWGGGVGLLVGLVAPVLLAPVVVGAAAGALVGKFAKHKVESGVESGLGEKLKPGMAAILAIVREGDRLAAQQAMADSPAKSVAIVDEGLKDVLAEAAGKFNPDLTVLPIPDRTFGGTIGRTLDTAVADWTMIPHAKPPEARSECPAGPHRRRRFRRPRVVWRRHQHSHVHARAGDGLDLQPVSRDRPVLPDAGGAAHGPQPAPGGHGFDRRISRSVPRLHGSATAELHRPAPHPPGERLRHWRLRQVAHDARQRAGRGGSVQQLAVIVGLRPLLGLPERRRRPVRSDHHAGQLDARCA